jgi:hypothetical protein
MIISVKTEERTRLSTKKRHICQPMPMNGLHLREPIGLIIWQPYFNSAPPVQLEEKIKNMGNANV